MLDRYRDRQIDREIDRQIERYIERNIDKDRLKDTQLKRSKSNMQEQIFIKQRKIKKQMNIVFAFYWRREICNFYQLSINISQTF